MATVLIVDDEPDVLEGFTALIDGLPEGHVLTATNGKAGLALLAVHAVDVIISDYRMPEMNGLEFLALARKVAPDVPAFLVTAFPDVEIERKAHALGVFRFLSKSVDPDDLLGQVQMALGGHSPGAHAGPPNPGSNDLQSPSRARSGPGQGDGEGGSLTFSWTLASDGAPMELHQAFGHEEPQPGPRLHLV